MVYVVDASTRDQINSFEKYKRESKIRQKRHKFIRAFVSLVFPRTRALCLAISLLLTVTLLYLTHSFAMYTTPWHLCIN